MNDILLTPIKVKTPIRTVSDFMKALLRMRPDATIVMNIIESNDSYSWHEIELTFTNEHSTDPQLVVLEPGKQVGC